MKRFRGKIIEVKTSRGGFAYVISGIKKNEQYKYDGQFGSNGTYAGADHTFPTIDIVVFIYKYSDDGSSKILEIDSRETILKFYNRLKSSDSLIAKLKSLLVGKKVTVEIPDYWASSEFSPKILGLEDYLKES